MQVHILHPVVLILGVLFALRRMSVSQQQADQHPGVAADAFDRWKLQASRAYFLGMSACFGKVLLDYLLAYLFPAVSAAALPRSFRIGIGLTLDVAWVVLVIVSYLRVRKAHALAREIGVERPLAG